MPTKYHNRSISLLLIAAILTGLLQASPVKAVGRADAVSAMLSNPHTDAEGVSTWDCIYFGNYWQSDTNGDGIADQNDKKEPIKWRILSVDGDDAFLLADQCLNSLSYHTKYEDATWEHSTLRSWLNGYDRESNTEEIDYSDGNFIDAAFSQGEQAVIKQTELNNKDNPDLETLGGNDTVDKIYLPSIQDVTNAEYGFSDNMYGSNTRVATKTAYVEPDYYDYVGGYLWGTAAVWRLRSPGVPSRQLCVEASGRIDDRGLDTLSWLGIRPVLHLDISDVDFWTYAGKVSADGANPVLPTASPHATSSCTPSPSPHNTSAADSTAAPDKSLVPDVRELEEDIMNYGSGSSGVCRQIPCEEKDGIYFLNRDKLYLYDLDTGKGELVYTFQYIMENQKPANMSVQASYVSGNVLYIAAKCYYGSTDTAVIQSYNLVDGMEGKTITLPTVSCNTVGVDSQGRLYTSDYEYLYLLDDNGQILDKTKTEFNIYRIAGFDSRTGNFYFESYANWVYWGYDHDMNVLRMGNVTDGHLTIDTTYNVLLSQLHFSNRERQLETVDDKYIFADSTVYSALYVYDMSQYSIPDKQGGEDGRIPTVGNALMAIGRNNKDADGEVSYFAAVGTRTAYMPETDSMVSYVDDSNLVEYDLETKAEIANVKTAHPVFSLMRCGQYVVAVEREGGQYYIEKFFWKRAENLTIQSRQTQLRIGENMDCLVESDGGLAERYTWTTSDAAVASVNQNGKVTAWKEGTVTITVKTPSGVSASKTIMVTANPSIQIPDKNTLTLSGTVTDNASANTYTVWSRVMNSYLTENADGTLTRMEYSNNKIILETYAKDSERVINNATVNMELSLFGGLYAGKKYNYIVFGAANPLDSSDVEVMRVVQYDKTWRRISALSYRGCNTNIPFEAGCLRMTEQGGKLYVYTCHEMFTTQDGLNHQSNMTFVINEEDMSEAESYYDIMNIAQAGYVSHSFNQFIRAEKDFVYRVDHGDANPRGISITACRTDGSITKVRYTIPITLDGIEGYNATGASTGGFECSTDNCLIAGNCVDTTKTSSPSDVRNVFISVTDKEFGSSEIKWLTHYTDSNVAVGTPQLVKMNEEQFLVLWEEKYNQKGTYTAMATIDGAGNLTSQVIRTKYRLSDCQPLYCSDGIVRWYASDGKQVTLYQIQPLFLSQMKGIVSSEDIKNDNGTSSSGGWNDAGGGTSSFDEWNIQHKVTWKVTKQKTIKIKTPAKVKAVSRKKRSITISWKKCSGASGYQILLAKNKKFSKGKKRITVKNGNKKTMTRKKLKSKTTYYVKIRAYKKVNSKKLYGKYSKTVKVKVK